jgi:N-hydroxyarylamine O-acetyltransferase
MNYENYLNRIGFEGNPIADFNTLKTLHKKHLYSIPFENLDIHTGKKIILDLEHLENKIINLKRGGFCYELNGLFYELLKHIGYNVKMVSASVFDDEERPGADFDHMALIVNINGDEYLADVGFGDNFMEPLLFNIDFVYDDEAGFFQIVHEDKKKYKLMYSEDGVYFSPRYLFSKEPRSLSDYENMCIYHQTSPKSHFTKNKLCSLANREGRITLVNDKLIITQNNKKNETHIRGEKEFNENLEKHFKITL